MAKVSKTELARRGTKADAERVEKSQGREVDSEKPWLIAPLDMDNLSSRERLTRRIFTTAEVVLCIIPFIVLGMFSMQLGGLVVDDLQQLFNEEPAAGLSLMSACIQPFVAYLLRYTYKRYTEGDAGYAVANLIALLCVEMALQHMLGIVAVALLLWRLWHRGAGVVGAWASGRKIGGVLFDLSGPLVALVLALICLFASSRIAA